MNEYDQRKYITASNTNIAHTCGNVCAIITEHFKSKFPPNFFKHEHVTTEIAIRQFKKIKLDKTELKWEKPYLIIQPKLVMGDPTEAHIDIWRRLYNTTVYDVTRSMNDTSKFFYDDRNNLMVDFAVERAKMSFQFSLCVSTEYQQYNIASHMNNTLRIEHPYYLPVRLETIIPEYIINKLAKDSNIPVLDENNKPYTFLKYINKISKIPVTLEFQPATGKYRFRLVVKTSLLLRFTNLDINEGDQENMIIDSYDLSVNVDMEFNYPSRFFYITDENNSPTFDLTRKQNDLEIEYQNLNDVVDMSTQASFFHTIQKVMIPEEDVSHKKLYDVVAFLTDNEDEDIINFKDLISQEYVDIIKYLKEKSIPISTFININIYENEIPKSDKDYNLNFDDYKLTIKNTKSYFTYRIALYIDNNILYDHQLRNYKYE